MRSVPLARFGNRVSCLIVTLVLISFVLPPVEARADLPPWVRTPPVSENYLYVVGLSSHRGSLELARGNAIKNALGQIQRIGHIRVTESQTFRRQDETRYEDGEYSSRELAVLEQDLRLEGRSQDIRGLVIQEEHWQPFRSARSTYINYWVLLRVPRAVLDIDGAGALLSPPGHGVTPFLRSSLLPGWGQVVKGEPVKGLVFMLSTTVLAVGSGVAWWISEDYEDRAWDASTIEDRQEYNRRATDFHYISMASGALAALLYTYNLVDVIVAPGAPRYAQNGGTHDGEGLVVSPQLLAWRARF